ncbi:hypothetical protein [Nonomuraea africana]|uniref:hypothetical protein n=1 Tax=Nonomuraea africana TaxID=46171 RepID=UPI00340F975E
MNHSSQRLIVALPYLMMVVVGSIDLLSGPEIGFLPLVALGPAFASLAGGVRRTATIGLVALLLCVLLASYNNVLGSRRSFTSLASVIGVTAAGMVAAAGRQRREKELADVRSIAEVAQRVLLRPVPRRAGHLRAAVSYTSAVAEARIGGDLYEVVTAPGGARVIVGDVQGKGLEAVETAAVVLGAFREAAHGDRRGEFYPLADRVSLLRADDPEAALEALRLDLVAHVDGPLHDDAAMLLLRHLG